MAAMRSSRRRWPWSTVPSNRLASTWFLVGVGLLIAFPSLGAGASSSGAAPIRSSESGAPPSIAAPAAPRSLAHGPPGPNLIRPTSFSGHYYAGAEYAAGNISATNISVDILVPQDNPQPRDFYYVLDSVWDNAGSYDQLGLASNNGTWQVTYSTATPCTSSVYHYNANAFPLTPGTVYLFDMQITSGGGLDFSVSYLAGGVVWSFPDSTGATAFAINNMQSCGSAGSFYGYTNYEEVYDTTAPVPPYTFFFTNNSVNSKSETQWGTFESATAPSGLRAVTGGSEVVVENEPFNPAANRTLLSEVGPTSRNYSETVSVAEYLTDGTLTVSEAGSVPNASVQVSPQSGIAPFRFNVTITVNPNTLPGSGYPLEFEVTDPGGVYARIVILAQVNARLQATTPTLKPAGADVNRSVTITEAPDGGSGTYIYAWAGLPTGCAGSSASVTCTPTLIGNYSVYVGVLDSLGFFSNSSTYVLEVYPELTLRVTSNVSGLDAGQSIEFLAEPSGGSGGLSFTWSYGSSMGCLPAGASLSCTVRSAGSLTATASATDLNDARVTSSDSVTVSPDPTATLAASRSSTDPGVPVTLTVTGSGGLPTTGGFGYTIHWTGLPSDCKASGPAAFACSWSSPGHEPITATVTDANGGTSAPASVSITVVAALSVAIEQTSYSALEGQTVSISANVSGGVGPFHYAWSGLPAGCSGATGANLSCQFQASGTFAISVKVTDGLGQNATATGAISIQPLFLGLPAAEGFAVVGGVVAALAAAVGVAFLLRARRRRRTPPPEAAPPE
jgi:large repetitive protein